MKKVLLLLALLPAFAQAENHTTRYACKSEPGVYPTLTIEIIESFTLDGTLLVADAHLVEGDFVDYLNELWPSQEEIPENPHAYKNFWTNERIIFSATFLRNHPNQSFMGEFTHPKYEDPVRVSCVIASGN
jgi:hypothetical protein